MEFIAAILVFLTLLSFAYAFHSAGINHASQTQELLRRLAKPPVVETAPHLEGRRSRSREKRFLEQLLGRTNLLEALEREMWQAGVYTRVADVLLLMVLLFGAGAAGMFMVWHDPFIAVGAGAIPAVLPVAYIKIRRHRRLASFGAQLPEMLDLLKSSLEAGHSLVRGLQVVVDEFADPVRSEMRMLLEQTRLGISLPRAFEDMLKRVPDESLRFMVVAIKIQAEVGSSLADIIGRLAETIRARQRIHLQIRALTAQPRMSGTIVGLLPVIVLGFFTIIQPSYAASMFYDPLGLKILKIAIGLDIMAFFIIRRVLKSDY
jgi:tight adherence protein B